MALTALTYSKRPLGLVGCGDEGLIQYLTARIDYRDVATHTTTYNIFDLPAKSAVLFCWLIVETSFAGTSATVLVDESSGSATYISATDGPVGDLTAGTVIKGSNSNDGVSVLNTVAGHDDEYDLAARTVDWTTGTAAFTAGVATLIIGFVTLP